MQPIRARRIAFGAQESRNTDLIQAGPIHEITGHLESTEQLLVCLQLGFGAIQAVLAESSVSEMKLQVQRANEISVCLILPSLLPLPFAAALLVLTGYRPYQDVGQVRGAY